VIGAETKRPRSDLTRPVRSEWAQIELGFSVSSCSDGERVSVVGQDRPSGPDLAAFVALEPGSVHAVATFEVTDPSFGTGSVARQASLGPAAAGLLAAGDEHPLRLQVVIVERLAGRARVEGAVQRDLARGAIPSRVSSLIVSGSSVSSVGFPNRVDGGTIKPRAPRRVCSVISQICATYPNSVGYSDIRIAEPVPIARLSRDGPRGGGDRPACARVSGPEGPVVVGIVTGLRGTRGACRVACSVRV
jgi:hypothetical protein